jgi:hypothetical protein
MVFSECLNLDNEATTALPNMRMTYPATQQYIPQDLNHDQVQFEHHVKYMWYCTSETKNSIYLTNFGVKFNIKLN